MLKLCRFTKVKVFFLVLISVFNFDLFEFSAAILEKGLLENAGPYLGQIISLTPCVGDITRIMTRSLYAVVNMCLGVLPLMNCLRKLTQS